MPLRYARIYSFFFNSNHVYHRLYVISSLLSFLFVKIYFTCKLKCLSMPFFLLVFKIKVKFTKRKLTIFKCTVQ